MLFVAYLVTRVCSKLTILLKIEIKLASLTFKHSENSTIRTYSFRKSLYLCVLDQLYSKVVPAICKSITCSTFPSTDVLSGFVVIFFLQFIIKLQFGMRAKKLTELPAPKTIRGMSAIFLELACVLVISSDMGKVLKLTAIRLHILLFVYNKKRQNTDLNP